jgi:hypothetical protein
VRLVAEDALDVLEEAAIAEMDVDAGALGLEQRLRLLPVEHGASRGEPGDPVVGALPVVATGGFAWVGRKRGCERCERKGHDELLLARENMSRARLRSTTRNFEARTWLVFDDRASVRHFSRPPADNAPSLILVQAIGMKSNGSRFCARPRRKPVKRNQRRTITFSAYVNHLVPAGTRFRA